MADKGPREKAFLDTPGVFKKLTEIAEKHGFSVDELLTVIRKESGFRTGVRNFKGSGATGLIQFMPGTAKDLGTTTDAISKMNSLEQLYYVDKYFSRNHTYGEHPYLTIAYPKAARMGADEIIAKPGSKIWKQNPVWRDENGNITKRGILSYVGKELEGDNPYKAEKVVDPALLEQRKDRIPSNLDKTPFKHMYKNSKTPIDKAVNAMMETANWSKSTISAEDYEDMENAMGGYLTSKGDMPAAIDSAYATLIRAAHSRVDKKALGETLKEDDMYKGSFTERLKDEVIREGKELSNLWNDPKTFGKDLVRQFKEEPTSEDLDFVPEKAYGGFLQPNGRKSNMKRIEDQIAQSKTNKI